MITEEQLARLTEEKIQLVERIGKLKDFINTDKFESIEESHKSLLRVQLSIMKSYNKILVERIFLLIK